MDKEWKQSENKKEAEKRKIIMALGCNTSFFSRLQKTQNIASPVP